MSLFYPALRGRWSTGSGVYRALASGVERACAPVSGRAVQGAAHAAGHRPRPHGADPDVLARREDGRAPPAHRA